jgi:signal transduction histidine kinase
MVESNREIQPAKLHQVASEVSDQVSRASAIINQLRQFGRKPDFEKELVDINSPINAVYKMIGPQLKLQDIQVTLDLDTTIPPILAQSNRLEQVFFNLLTNASDSIAQKQAATDQAQQDQIIIRSYTQGDHICVLVSDTGIGIPEQIKRRIFEPFFTTKEVGKGMGLGLSIIYGIVKEYGGEIEVLSTPTLTTTFKLTFPAEPPSEL